MKSPTIIGVLYGRYSGGSKQREKDISIEQQFKECRDYCRWHGIKIIGTYEDRGITGTKDKRKGFQRMIEDSAKGKFDAVVIWKMERFARNREDSAIYKGRLRRNGVKVISVTESIPDTPEGILIEGNLETYAEFFSRKLSQDVTRGLKYNAADCKVNGPLPLGYRRGADGRAEIVPEAAEAVRKIFKDYAAGITTKTIAAELNVQGFTTNRGKPFDRSSFERILKNERYMGIYIYDDIRVEGGMPRIVEPDIFAKVQGRLRKAAKAPAASRQIDYPLTGKLYCGICGRPMIGECGRGRSGQVYRYYKCIDKKHGGECECRAVPKERAETALAKLICKEALTPEVIKEIVESALNMQEQTVKQAASETARLRRKLKETRNKIANIISAIEQGVFTSSTKDQLLLLEEQENAFAELIDKAAETITTWTQAQLLFFFEEWAGGAVKDVEFREALFDLFVSAIYLDGGTARVVIKYAPDAPDVGISIPIDDTPPEDDVFVFGATGGS